MNVSGVSVKEAVETIEERIPGGRFLVRIVILLAVLSLITLFVVYLYHNLRLPVTTRITSWFTGVPSGVGGSISNILTALLCAGLIWVFGDLAIKKFETYSEKLFARDGLVVSALDRLAEAFESLESRVSLLEQASSQEIASGD